METCSAHSMRRLRNAPRVKGTGLCSYITSRDAIRSGLAFLRAFDPRDGAKLAVRSRQSASATETAGNHGRYGIGIRKIGVIDWVEKALYFVRQRGGDDMA